MNSETNNDIVAKDVDKCQFPFYYPGGAVCFKNKQDITNTVFLIQEYNELMLKKQELEKNIEDSIKNQPIIKLTKSIENFGDFGGLVDSRYMYVKILNGIHAGKYISIVNTSPSSYNRKYYTTLSASSNKIRIKFYDNTMSIYGAANTLDKVRYMTSVNGRCGPGRRFQNPLTDYSIYIEQGSYSKTYDSTWFFKGTTTNFKICTKDNENDANRKYLGFCDSGIARLEDKNSSITYSLVNY